MIPDDPTPRKVICRWSKFRTGEIVIMPGAAAIVAQAGQSWMDFVLRHVIGDWGDLSAEDKRANDAACQQEGDVERQERILSAYCTTRGNKLWVITECDRSATTLLLPEEY